MWTKLKSMQWVITAGMILSGILLALAGARAVKKRKRAAKNEDLGKRLQHSLISKELDKSKKLLEAADKDKDAAIKADEAMEAQLEKLGEANTSLDAIADRFNSKRLRSTAK